VTAPTPLTGRLSNVLEVCGLTVALPRGGDRRDAVEDVSFAVGRGEILCIVGESGSGKSMIAHTVMGLLPPALKVTGGTILLEGEELVAGSGARLRELRGSRMSMIFQEPMSALNPVVKVSKQIAEVLSVHTDMPPRERQARVLDVMEAVNLPEPDRLMEAYPHQLSGGQRQRVMIAAALVLEPSLLIADEPTTALDVTIQAQILDLMQSLQDEIGMAMQFISHNLAVISEIAHEIVVMYAGRVVERAAADDLFSTPLHPYTLGLIATLPDPSRRSATLPVIPGNVGDMDGVRGCRFADRCERADAGCLRTEPPLEQVSPEHWVACFKVGA
jgi:oligopeptide/dipeptide ABC transporter ATP-binding protein